jgi:dodecin
MAESVYKVIELVGTSTTSWERAAAAAVKMAAGSLRDLRVAEITQLDMHLEDNKVIAYRAKVKVSFKYTPGSSEDANPAPAVSRPSPRKAAPAPEPAPEAAPARKSARRGKKKARRRG